jgi:hypothetical protein
MHAVEEEATGRVRVFNAGAEEGWRLRELCCSLTSFCHLNSFLLLLTRVGVLQTSENLSNHNARPVISAGFMLEREVRGKKNGIGRPKGFHVLTLCEAAARFSGL